MILDGKKLQEKRFKILKKKVSKKKNKPVLVIVQIGNNKASEIYIKKKLEFGKKLGVGVEHYQLKSTVTFAFIKKLIGDFNNDSEIKGIIVQLPLPKNFNSKKIVNLVDPQKDVDGLVAGSKFIPATARGVLTLLKENKIKIAGKKVVVIGRSFLVGAPIADLMRKQKADVKVIHSKTKSPASVSQKAYIIISAVGKPNLVKNNWVKEGAVIVDVGISKTKKGLIGDVDFMAVNKVARAITPVPGGVGPMTVVSLFENLVDGPKTK